MDPNSLYPRIARRLNPKLNELEGAAQRDVLVNMAPALFTAPTAALGLFWLLRVSDLEVVRQNAASFLVLFVSLLVINQQRFSVHLRLSEDHTVRVIGSLSPMVMWGGTLVFGPTACWLPVLAGLVTALGLSWTEKRRGGDTLWTLLSIMSQNLTSAALVPLLALQVYRALGGELPLVDPNPLTWLPALAAFVANALLLVVLMLPRVSQIYRLNQSPFNAATLRGYFTTMLAPLLASTPFAIILALAFNYGGFALFSYLAAGVVLVNSLAFYLSRLHERSQQRSRELERLEALSQALLQAAPDGSTLAQVLGEHLPHIFPYDHVDLRVFASQSGSSGDQAGERPQPPLHVQHSYSGLPASAPEALWQALPQAEEAYLPIPDVVRPGARAAFGDAVLVKIAAVSPAGAAAQCIGGIYLLRERRRGRVQDALPVLQTLAAQVGAALYRAQAYAETLEHQRVAQELAVAGRIQASFLPDEVPQLPGWDMAATLEPARQTSGDFYDFIPLGDGRLGIVVADVADKGMGAALFMALSRTLLRTYAMQHPDDPAKVLALTNERILADSKAEQFVTVFYGVLDLAAGRLTYASAGHNPAYVFAASNGQTPQELWRTGIPLGIFDDQRWQQGEVQLGQGDTLLVYSDGITEAQNSAGALFEEERLAQVGRAHLGAAAADIQTAVLQAVADFTAGAPQYDDVTLMVIVRQ